MPEEQGEKLIKEAEAVKARIFTTPGKQISLSQGEEGDANINKQFHLVMVDEDYLLVASHVDHNTLTKIVNGEYVDFAHLLARDKVLQEEDQRLENVLSPGDRKSKYF